MSTALTLLSLGCAAACFAIRELSAHGKLNPSGPSDGFWGEQSWRRKYDDDVSGLTHAPDNWYYRLFKIPFKERFPLSATALVWLTDGYHLMGFLMQLFIFFAIAGINQKMFLACWIAWSLFFNVFYTVFNRS